MRRLLGHIILTILVFNCSAQILAPMGEGLPEAPDKITSYKSGIVVVYDDRHSEIELQVWNGDFWYALEKPILPKVGEDINGTYSIVDLLSFNNDIYLATAYEQKVDGVTSNAISKWNGEEWSNVSNTLISESNSLDKLFIENGTIKCLGKFVSGLDKYNIIQLKDGEWIPQGNLITKNIENDGFMSIASKDGKLFATGKFTDPTSNNVSLAVWNGSEWAPAKNPPFLGENIALGNYKDKVVIYGKSEFNPQSIMISFGDNWKSLSAGLENYSVESVKQFAEVGENLFVLLRFSCPSFR